MLKDLFKKVGKAFINICLAFIMLIAIFYLRIYETHPYYMPKSV